MSVLGTYTSTGVVRADTNATPSSYALRDASGNLTNAAEFCTQITINGSISVAWTTKTSNYSLVWGVNGDHTIYADTTSGSVTLTLPSPTLVGAGGKFRVIRKSASNVLTLALNASEKINGTSSNKVVTATAFLICEIETDGTDWIVNTHTVI